MHTAIYNCSPIVDSIDKAIFRLEIQKIFIAWWLKCLMIQKKLLRPTNSLLGGIGMFMLEKIFLKFLDIDISKPVCKVPGLQKLCTGQDQGEVCRVKSTGGSR